MPPVTAKDKPWPLFRFWHHHLDQNAHHLYSTSAGGKDLSNDAQIRVIGSMEPEIILVPRAHDPSDPRQGSRALAWSNTRSLWFTDFLSNLANLIGWGLDSCAGQKDCGLWGWEWPEICLKMFRIIEWKTQSKISWDYAWLLHCKNCQSQWCFLRIFWTGSKPNRRSITTARRKGEKKNNLKNPWA